MTDKTPTQPETNQAPLLFLSDEPAKIATYINHRKKNADAPAEDNASATPPYSFADFASEMTMTDFNDDFQIRATLESQAHLLGTAFNYLMMEGDWKNLAFILRAQKTMRDTIELMNKYPPLTYLTIHNHESGQESKTNDAPMD